MKIWGRGWLKSHLIPDNRKKKHIERHESNPRFSKGEENAWATDTKDIHGRSGGFHQSRLTFRLIAIPPADSRSSRGAATHQTVGRKGNKRKKRKGGKRGKRKTVSREIESSARRCTYTLDYEDALGSRSVSLAPCETHVRVAKRKRDRERREREREGWRMEERAKYRNSRDFTFERR